MIFAALMFVFGAWNVQQLAQLPCVTRLICAFFIAIAILVTHSRFSSDYLHPIYLSSKLLKQTLFCAAAFLLGVCWASGFAYWRMSDALPHAWEQKNIAIEGVVASVPEATEHGERFKFDVEKTFTKGAIVPKHISLNQYRANLYGRDSNKEAGEDVADLNQFHAGERWALVVRLLTPPHAGKVFNDVLGAVDVSQEACWRKELIESMTVLYFNSAETSRIKSGIINPGPQGILVGVGALGSVLLDIWTRSGWGIWSVIDEDHLKPHNLVRHIGVAADVGLPKVDVAVQHAYSITLGVTKVVGINADGGDFSNQSLLDTHKLSSLVVDASTTINYPHLASKRDDVSRHISVFVTPNGDSSVLLAEDQERKIRLRTLEAQYYRALINLELGQHNLYDTGGSFISGSSCRDISFIMPYSKIMNHATTLSEQIMTTTETTTSAIRVWNRSNIDGSVNSYKIAPESEICLSIEDFEIYLDEGLVKKIRSLRTQGLPNETGGILLGYYDFNVKTIVIVDVLSAPTDSLASKTSFERGTKGTQQRVQAIAKMTADMVGYIGEWHSHPSGHSANPSKDDYYQIAFLSIGMAEDGLPAISLIVGENDLQVLKCDATQ